MSKIKKDTKATTIDMNTQLVDVTLVSFFFSCKDGRVTVTTCKYFPLVVFEKFESEMVRRNLCGKISEAAKNYQKEVYYIHR